MWQWWMLYLQVPEGLADESGIPLNKGNIHKQRQAPTVCLQAYINLFERDFTLFLRLCSQEMVSGGHVVLTIIGSDRKADSSGNHSCTTWELLGITLNDMVQEIQNPLCLLFPSAETHGMYHLSLFYHPAPQGSRWPDVCDYSNHICILCL